MKPKSSPSKAVRSTGPKPRVETRHASGKAGGSETHDDFLARLPDAHRVLLEQVRRTIRSAAPKAEECFSYGLPAFRLEGRPLVAYGAAREHCSFYPMSATTVEAHAAELADFETSKGTIRFTVGHPLPATLVRKLVKARIAENRDRAVS